MLHKTEIRSKSFNGKFYWLTEVKKSHGRSMNSEKEPVDENSDIFRINNGLTGNEPTVDS